MTIERRFNSWIECINALETVDHSIVGFKFGIFETTGGYTMYLTGSRLFAETDEDWATHVDFEPSNKYFEFGSGFSEGKEWQEVLDYSAKLISGYIHSGSFDRSFLSKAKGITTGFDEGDLIIIFQRGLTALTS